jgi:hypothetical protein
MFILPVINNSRLFRLYLAKDCAWHIALVTQDFQGVTTSRRQFEFGREEFGGEFGEFGGGEFGGGEFGGNSEGIRRWGIRREFGGRNSEGHTLSPVVNPAFRFLLPDVPASSRTYVPVITPRLMNS